MTKTKKTVLAAAVGILVLAAVIAGYGFAFSPRDCGFGGFSRHCAFSKGMPPFLHGEIKGFIAWRMDQTANDLDLSDHQKALYDSFKNTFLDSLDLFSASRADLRQKAIAAFESENPELSLMAEEVRVHIESVSGAMSQNLVRLAEFFDSLDSARKNELTGMIKARLDHRFSRLAVDGKDF